MACAIQKSSTSFVIGATPNKNISGPVGQPGETHASRGPLGGLTIAFLAPKKNRASSCAKKWHKPESVPPGRGCRRRCTEQKKYCRPGLCTDFARVGLSFGWAIRWFIPALQFARRGPKRPDKNCTPRCIFLQARQILTSIAGRFKGRGGNRFSCGPPGGLTITFISLLGADRPSAVPKTPVLQPWAACWASF